MELVFDLEMVNQFASVFVVDAVTGVEADGVDVASDGGAVFEGFEGIAGLGESEAEHAESTEGEEKREEGSPGGGEENGDGHEGAKGEEDEADPGGDVSGETGAKGEAFGEHAWRGGRRGAEFHAGQRGHWAAAGRALVLPGGVVGVAPAAGDHGIGYRMGKEKARERLSDFRPRPFVGWAEVG